MKAEHDCTANTAFFNRLALRECYKGLPRRGCGNEKLTRARCGGRQSGNVHPVGPPSGAVATCVGFEYARLGIMIIFRALLVGLLTVAFTVTAWAHCCVGLGFEAALSHAAQVQHGTIDHDDEGDCGKSKARVCDAMVQASAPQAPVIAPSLLPHAASPIFVASESSAPVFVVDAGTDPPPLRAQRFKDIYAKTGRLLV